MFLRYRSERTTSRTDSSQQSTAKKARVNTFPRRLMDFAIADLDQLKLKLRDETIQDPKTSFDEDSIKGAGFMFFHIEGLNEVILFATPNGQTFRVTDQIPDSLKKLLEDITIVKIGDPMSLRMIVLLYGIKFEGHFDPDQMDQVELRPLFKDNIEIDPEIESPELMPLAVRNIRKLIWRFWATVIGTDANLTKSSNIAPLTRLLFARYGSLRGRTPTFKAATPDQKFVEILLRDPYCPEKDKEETKDLVQSDTALNVNLRDSSIIKGTKIFVYGVDHSCPKSIIEEKFLKYGAVSNVDITEKGYAFVKMNNEGEARAAVNELHGSIIDGQKVEVSFYQGRVGGRGFGGNRRGGNGGGRYGRREGRGSGGGSGSGRSGDRKRGYRGGNGRSGIDRERRRHGGDCRGERGGDSYTRRSDN